MIDFLISRKKQIIIFLFIILVSGVSHAYNMFNFPYYENDEGVYMSQAWALLEMNELAPYTYWYDHAPGGWILIAIWTKLTGGFFTFGTSVNSGRVLMLVIHIISAVVLYWIAKKLTKSHMAGIISVLIFSLSPLGIYFQRRVLLDNMMIFWVLLSLALLLRKNLKIGHTILSAILFGFAVLTKENSIFFLPAFVYVVYIKSNHKNRSFSIFLWILIGLMVISYYFVYALFKNEFFPSGFLGNPTDHVSLLSSMQQQLSRGADSGSFWQEGNIFYTNLVTWIARDSFTIVTGAVATIFSFLIGIKQKDVRIPALFSLLFWAFLLRGSLVLDFYIVPLIPLLALNVGVVTAYSVKKISSNSNIRNYLNFVIVTIFLFYLLTPTQEHYIQNETISQKQTIDWINNNLDPEDNIVIDNSIWVDLHDERFPGDKKFPNADWSWKVEKDSDIYEGKLNENWRNIDYIALSHEILRQIREGEFRFIEKAYVNSEMIIEWKEGSKSYIDLENNISTNGDWMAIHRVKEDKNIVLDSSWRYYKNNFIRSYGQVVDLETGMTTSEGQSYALLRAVWENDKETFDGVLAWTNDHLNHRIQDNLISWQWGENLSGEEELLDPASAADADIDIALALLFAYRQWGDQDYLFQARGLIQDIWEHEVIDINDRLYLIAGSDSEVENYIIVNPSYFSPAHYRIFAEIDNTNNWNKLANDTYLILDKIERQLNVTNSLYPNWIAVDKNNGTILSARSIRDNADDYGYDAFRLAWRIALDKEWHQNEQAETVLRELYEFYNDELTQHSRIAAVYDSSGNSLVEYSDLSTNSAALAVFSIFDPRLARNYYINHFEAQFDFDNGYWIQKDNYYKQNWAWFGTAFFAGEVQNLWMTPRTAQQQ